MKEKTSITLSREVLAQIDRLSGERSRSAFIERILCEYLRERKQKAERARDLELLNASADRLNEEASEVLDYQSPLD